jgi:hypothetical protein
LKYSTTSLPFIFLATGIVHCFRKLHRHETTPDLNSITSVPTNRRLHRREGHRRGDIFQRKDDSTKGENISNPSSKRIMSTYLDLLMENMMSPKRMTHITKEIRNEVENQIKNIEKMIKI